jgi:hypothetical protein
MAIRVVSAARDAELWARQAGWATAAEVLARRRGCAYDPAVVDALSGHGQAWLAGIGDDPRAAILDAEPAPVLTVDDSRIDGALRAVADFADLKSPFFLGHSTGVAVIAGEAATAAGLSDEDAATGRARARRRQGRRRIRHLGPPGAAERRPMGARAAPHLPRGAGVVPLPTARAVHGHCRSPPRASRRFRLPSRPRRRPARRRRADLGSCGRVPRADRATSSPTGADAGGCCDTTPRRGRRQTARACRGRRGARRRRPGPAVRLTSTGLPASPNGRSTSYV